MNTKQLGRLKKVDLREGWASEAGDFTPWLAQEENLKLLSETIGIQSEYSFNGMGQKDVKIPLLPEPKDGQAVPTDFHADMNMQFGDVNIVFKPRTDGRAKPYVVAGGGVYYRPVTVTTPGVGYIPGFCDPWWYVCYPGGFVPVENVVGSGLFIYWSMFNPPYAPGEGDPDEVQKFHIRWERILNGVH